MTCKLKECEYVCAHVPKIHRQMERLEKLNVNFDKELAIDMVFDSWPSYYDKFILTYHLNSTETKLVQLHNLLQIAKVGIRSLVLPVLLLLLSWPSIKEIGRRWNVSPNPSRKGKPMLESLIVGQIVKITMISLLSAIQKRSFTFIVAKRGIGEKLPIIPSRGEKGKGKIVWFLIWYVYYQNK